jgi:hypothetical protein
VVSPGFVDLHTHLDAQIGWDPALTPVSWHGVTPRRAWRWLQDQPPSCGPPLTFSFTVLLSFQP